MAMFTANLHLDAHSRRYSISPLSESGWEVRLEEDRKLTHHVCYHDWHRVERTLAVFRLEVAELTAQGWARAERER
jgi:hypothetical protein